MKGAISTSILAIIALTACAPQSSREAGDVLSDSLEASDHLAVETVDGVTTVRLQGDDRMRYSLSEFSVKTGDTVRIVFANVGRMPKTAMGHNLIVLKQSVDANAYAGKAAMARDTDFIPVSEAGAVIAHTSLLGPDESDTIEFVAPAPGEYVYLCSFPAHCFAGMRGVMTVLAAE